MSPPTIATATTIAPTPVARRRVDEIVAAPERLATRAIAVATLTRASRATAFGEPTAGITKNGIAKVAVIEPAVLAARRRPALAAIRAGSSPRRVDAAGKVKPITIVAGRTTKMIGRRIACADSSAFPGSILPGWPMTRTSPPIATAATITWAIAISPIGLRMLRRLYAKSVAPIVIPIRNIPRIRVKTYVELPVPDDRRRVHRTW